MTERTTTATEATAGGAVSATCPVCDGSRLAGHKAGLVVQHTLSCPLLAAEDVTQAADHDRFEHWPAPFERPVTAAERTLLVAFGHTVAADAVTSVRRISTIRVRSWAGVDLEAPAAAGGGSTPPPGAL